MAFLSFLLCGTYFELLLRDVSAVGFEELQHVGDEVSAAEVVGSQSGEENPLGPTPHLAGGTAGSPRSTRQSEPAGAWH